MKLNFDNLKGKFEHIKDVNMIKDEKQLKVIVDKEVKKLLGESAMEV